MKMKKLVYIMGLLAILIAVPPVWADDDSGLTVLRSTSEKAEGLGGYGTLAAEWWQWALSIPVTDNEEATLHPLEDENGEKCYVGQRGSVWFIGGKIVADPDPDETEAYKVEVERDCTIPVGKAVFFPIFNYGVSTIETDLQAEEDLRDEAEKIHEWIKEASVDIDENLVLSLEDLQEEFSGPSSPLSKFFLPENNYLQKNSDSPEKFPGGAESEFVADGMHVLIAPVEQPGEYKIHFKGRLEADEYDFILNLDVVYNLTFVDDDYDYGGQEARKKTEEQAKKKTEEQAKKKTEEQAKKKTEEQAKKKTEEQAKKKTEEQAKKKGEEE